MLQPRLFNYLSVCEQFIASLQLFWSTTNYTIAFSNYRLIHFRYLIATTLILAISQIAQSQNFELAENTPFYDLRAGDVDFSDVDNDGDYDILLVGNRNESDLAQPDNFIAILYENDGMGNFSEVSGTPFIGLQESTVAFADVDGDNDEDVMISGIDYLFDQYTRLYLNDGNGNFSIAPSNPFTDVYAGDIVFADVDEDEDLDVFIAGSTVAFQTISYSGLYINDGAGGFTEKANTPFANVQDASIGVSDFDLDGDLDMLLLGVSEVPAPITQAYINDGLGNYTIATNYSFEQLSSGDIQFSDTDNDGDEDLLIAGTNDGGLTPYTSLYENDGTGNFTVVQNPAIVDLKWVSSLFFDFDNDGDEDLIMTGKTGTDPWIFGDEGVETFLFSNDGNGVFEEVENHPIPPIYFGNMASADFNGDNFNDIFITGQFDNAPTHYSELFFSTAIVSSLDQNQSSTAFNIYPNPAYDKIFIDRKNSESSLIEIFTMAGVRVHSIQSMGNHLEEMYITKLPEGIYTVKVQTDTGDVSVKKFIKNSIQK